MFVKTEERPQGEEQETTVRITKLSQAIRIGAALRPQCFGDVFANGGSCAWGAAAEALGHPANRNIPTMQAMRWVTAKLGLPASLVEHECKARVDETIWGTSDNISRHAAADLAERMGY